MEYTNIELARTGPILRVTVNRPAKLNALNSQTLTEIGEAFGGKNHSTVIHAIEKVREQIKRLSFVRAVGEIGLDYHYDLSPRPTQQAVFRAQIRLARELKLPVVIHSRDADQDTIDALKSAGGGEVRGVFHCFGNTPDQASEILALGHLVSFTGIVTFKNAEPVREVVASIPADAFMVETDCPYLAPVPHRGKRCEPAHTRLVAEKIAEVRGVSLNEIAAVTTRTAESFFRLSA